ncbi:hypothetical protein RRG08_017314 [Elysia crispata]|uniref:Protein kinase domain-containing protein n=1 Tax=Elysia crispata TaxID=231223 RepID=A0AAE0ZEK2_9GAST|nr:hypothetical protein RRG08_017314 [Elysia crispata]
MPRNYVDNAMNRSLGRVGMPVGSAVHSSSSSSPTRTYVDNSMNRSLGGVGLPVGTAVHSRGASPCTSSSSTKCYVDNPYNRKLGRVGLPVGTAVHREGDPLLNPDHSLSSRIDGKVYTDNPFNRKHKRVGLPLGSKPIRRRDSVYADNPVNRHLNRVGLPMGSKVVKKNQLAQIRNWLENKAHTQKTLDLVEDSGFIGSEILSSYGSSDREWDEESIDNYNHVRETLNRAEQEDLWAELKSKPIQSCTLSNDTSKGKANQMHGKTIKFEDLTLYDKIGHGGFGEVYLAEYKGVALAVKILNQTNLSKKRLELFEKEIINHSKLDHANIVQFYGPCLERPNLAIVMEYMDASLWESLHINEVNFLLIHKLHIIQHITSGLDYLHGIPLVHGDLKTQNVLLINVPDTLNFDKDLSTVAKLSDFGLSELKADTETSQSSEQEKKFPIGATLRSAAPEVIRGEMLEASEMLKTDIYSMGLIIMELAVEQIAFEDLTMAQLVEQVGKLGARPSAPPGLNLDKYLQSMLDKCWSFEATERLDARQLKKLASKLEAILEEE